MFKHHKYCVIEVSGLLVAVENARGVLGVYLLDNGVKMDGLSLVDDKSKRVRVTDTDLIEFIRQRLQRGDGECKFSGQAQLAGTVDMDDGEAQLSYVSQAFIHDKERLLKYEPQQSAAQGNPHDY
jgi:hypothetical protein